MNTHPDSSPGALRRLLTDTVGSSRVSKSWVPTLSPVALQSVARGSERGWGPARWNNRGILERTIAIGAETAVILPVAPPSVVVESERGRGPDRRDDGWGSPDQITIETGDPHETLSGGAGADSSKPAVSRDPRSEVPSESPESRSLRGLVHDEQAAVMVLGIFMCTALVGVLWYLAGIGEAVIFRERIQEASDAAAFSGAVLHARGMNIIVLINLVMACVLGIRVALKVVQLALVIVGAIFTAIGWFVPPVAPFGALAFKGAGEVQTLISNLKNPIDNALKALSAAQRGIARVVPLAACAGGTIVGNKYAPATTLAVSAIGEATITGGLPVEEGTGGRLCYEAGRAFAELLWWAVPDFLQDMKGGTAGDRFAGVVGKIVDRGGAYFCENGSGGSAPNLDDVLDDTANEHCDAKRDDLAQKYQEANSAWHAKCSEYGVVCTDPVFFGGPASMGDTSSVTPASRRTELNDLKTGRDDAQTKYEEFDWGACKNQKMGDMRNDIQNNGGQQSSGGGSSENMTPKKTKADWRNGVKPTQVMGWALGDKRFIRMAPKGVKVGAMRSRTDEIETPHGADFASSQAEYFYDCPGEWQGNQCNGQHRDDNEDAMWHFKWRARFRRYNRPYDNLSSFIEVPYAIPAHAALVAAAFNSRTLELTSPGNIQLKAELAKFWNVTDTIDVTLH